MNKSGILNIVLFFLIMAFWVGCSATESNPVNSSGILSESGSGNLPVIGSVEDPYSVTGTAGMYEGFINIDTLEAGLNPVRKIAAGGTDSLDVDVTSFLLGTPCSDCVDLKGVSISPDGYPVLSIGIRHPFPPGDLTGQPTAANRLDLHVFNVRGFIVTDGYEGLRTFSGMGKTLGGFILKNKDGLSGEFDVYWDEHHSTTANLHPYRLHFRDYSVGNFDKLNENGFTDLKVPEGNLVMRMGSDFDVQDYVIEIESTGSFEFLYVVTANYGISALGKLERLIATYRIPQFNAKSASEFRVTSVDDTLLFDGNTGSSCIISVEIMDINHGVAVGEDIDQMTFDSSVGSFIVDIPGVTNPTWETTSPNLFYTSGDGRTDPLVYDIVVTNDAGGSEGAYSGLIGVVDSFADAGALPGNAIFGLPPGGDPETAFFTVDSWVTYNTFDVNVNTSCGPISGSITLPTQSAITINNGDVVDFTGEGSSINGGDPITQYKWKWGDSTPDSLGSSVSHQFFNDNCSGNMESVNYNVNLELTDSCSPANVTVVDTIQVTVECPDCFNYFENFDNGTTGDWDVLDWSIENTDSGGAYYGGFDEYNNHMMGPNCSMSKCFIGNCYFTSGDDTSQGHPPGFCNDYSGPGHYYLNSPELDFSSLAVSEVTMTVWHFYNVLDNPVVDGCAVYASINGGTTFPLHVAVSSGNSYNSTFTGGIRSGDDCFTGLVSGSMPTQTTFDLTPFINQSNLVLRFEQHTENSGLIGTPGYPVGWWIDEITIDICP